MFLLSLAPANTVGPTVSRFNLPTPSNTKFFTILHLPSDTWGTEYDIHHPLCTTLMITRPLMVQSIIRLGHLRMFRPTMFTYHHTTDHRLPCYKLALQSIFRLGHNWVCLQYPHSSYATLHDCFVESWSVTPSAAFVMAWYTVSPAYTFLRPIFQRVGMSFLYILQLGLRFSF